MNELCLQLTKKIPVELECRASSMRDDKHGTLFTNARWLSVNHVFRDTFAGDSRGRFNADIFRRAAVSIRARGIRLDTRQVITVTLFLM